MKKSDLIPWDGPVPTSVSWMEILEAQVEVVGYDPNDEVLYWRQVSEPTGLELVGEMELSDGDGKLLSLDVMDEEWEAVADPDDDATNNHGETLTAFSHLLKALLVNDLPQMDYAAVVFHDGRAVGTFDLAHMPTADVLQTIRTKHGTLTVQEDDGRLVGDDD